MPLLIVKGDITKMKVDAIVNAANNSLLGGGGVDGMIHRAAGPGLLRECRTLGGCETGCSKLTGAYDLPCRYVIHTVGPVWHGGSCGEREKLASCYRTALELAEEHGCETVAFPLISSGVYGYPKDKALRVATEAVAGYLGGHDSDMTVYIMSYDGKIETERRLKQGISEYISEKFLTSRREGFVLPETPAEETADEEDECELPDVLGLFRPSEAVQAREDAGQKRRRWSEKKAAAAEMPSYQSVNAADGELEKRLSELDESFSEMLLRKIDERGMTDAQCYKRANISRKLFSKIRGDSTYRPSKPTALAFAVALELSLPETRELLMKAGFALSHSSKFDVIVEYFIVTGNYDVFAINEALFLYDQALLGM